MSHIMKTSLAGIAAASALMSGCSPNANSKAPLPMADDASVKIVGEPVSCLRTSTINSTKVIDDYTIDFDTGSKLYRNRLPNRCPSLASQDKFLYETVNGSLCDVDIIYVLNNYGGDLTKGPACGLGKFVPIKKVKKIHNN